MITPLKQLLTSFQGHKAIPAFNIDSFEIYQAVELAVKKTNLPCIVQLSAGEDKFIDAKRLLILVKKANIDGLPIYLNMDHGQDTARLLELARLGFDMLHFDASSLDYLTGLSRSQEFVKSARQISPEIIIETEFNRINLSGSEISPDSFTDPDQAAEFVLTTNPDLLAISIGNLHGVNTLTPEKIDLDRLNKIKQVVPPSVLFTLHGGSGIDLDAIHQAIKLGVVKININTDLRNQYKSSLLREINSTQSDKIYDYLTPVIDDVTKVVIDKINTFSTIS
ncbi:MAG: class II fructose-bisphosphate aldolase [Candidatus Shapirobacteria bacterium]|jgi:ketose-bisphosphate aldolase